MNPLTPLAVWIGARSWLPRFAGFVVGFDRLVQRLSGGHLTLLRMVGLPELVLTVPGNRSGIPRHTPLLYVPHGGAYLVAGSNWGKPGSPAWVHNLLVTPEASVEINGRRRRVKARVAVGEERQGLWEVMLRTWPNYAKYQQRTTRQIRVFVLEPVG